jgi:hypothetical protein
MFGVGIERARAFHVGVENPARPVKSDTCFAPVQERRVPVRF